MERDPATLKPSAASPKVLSDDQKVRLSMRGKEYQQIKESNREFDDEEEELKRFFNEGAKSTFKTEDPTIVSKIPTIREEKVRGEGSGI